LSASPPSRRLWRRAIAGHPVDPGARAGAANVKPWTIACAAAGAALVLVLFLFLHRTAAPPARENGVFENDCCGTLELRNGGMVINGKRSVSYTVGQDARGPYILPATYVGAYEDVGLEVDGTRPTTRLRLDRLPRPTSIVLFAGSKPYVFQRNPYAKSSDGAAGQ
jgi:hypothetical protein